MKRLDGIWLVGLLMVCTDALAKRRRSGSSAAMSPEVLGWIGAAGLGIGAIAILVTYGDVVAKLLNVVWVGALVWLFGQWNVDVAWCAYADFWAPARLPELCAAKDGEPHGELWRYGMYALAVAIYGGLLGIVVWFLSKQRLERKRRIAERRGYVEAMLRTKLPSMKREHVLAYVADCEAMINALERKAKRKVPNEGLDAVTDLWIALTEHHRSTGRKLTQDDIRSFLARHRIWGS